MKKETLLDYWLVIYTHKKIIGLVALASVVTSIVLSLVVTPVYEARSVCYVPDKSPSLSYMSLTSTDRFARDKLVPKATEDEAGPYIGMLKSVRIADYVHQEYPSKPVDKLLFADVDFELSDEFLIKIYSRDKDPILAANVANAYIKYLNLLLQNASLSNPQLDNTLLTKQLKDTEVELGKAKSDLIKFEEKHNIASIDEEIKVLTNQRIAFQTQLENATVQLLENDKKISSIKEELTKEGKILSENNITLTNATIEHLQKKLADQAAVIASSKIEMKETHPDVKILNSQYNETTERLKHEIQQLISSQIKPQDTFYEQLRQNLVNLIIEKNKLRASTEGYTEVLKRINERLQNLPDFKINWSKLNDNVTHYRRVYEQLRLNLQENEMQESRPINYVVAVDYATPPKTASFPILWLNIIVALLAGLIAGIFFAFFTDYIQTTQKARTLKIIKAVLSEE